VLSKNFCLNLKPNFVRYFLLELNFEELVKLSVKVEIYEGCINSRR
jgi:hypothetical protein